MTELEERFGDALREAASMAMADELADLRRQVQRLRVVEAAAMEYVISGGGYRQWDALRHALLGTNA